MRPVADELEENARGHEVWAGIAGGQAMSLESHEALQEAWKALRSGDRVTAKQQARLAIQLDPNCEEAWLILAGLSEPHAGLAYASRALEINPSSEIARKAVSELSNRVSAPPTRRAGRPETVDELFRREGSLWLDAWQAFRRHRAAVVGLIFLLTLALAAAAAPVVTPYDHDSVNLEYIRAKPMTRFEPDDETLESCHWDGTPLEGLCGVFIAGTDQSGRDLWSRTVYGARTSLTVASAASLTSLLIGILYGSTAGYVGGQTDEAMMRFVDFLYGIPVFLVVLGIQSFFHIWIDYGGGVLGILEEWNNRFGGLLFLFIAIGAVNWVNMARLSRAMVHAHKQKEYVEAARALGASEMQIMFRHLLPNVIGPLVVMETIAMPGYIFLEATLSFIGLGVTETSRYRTGSMSTIGPSWGGMIRAGYSGLRSSPHLVLFPSLALALLTLAFNFAGDGLRDAVDPRMRKKR